MPSPEFFTAGSHIKSFLDEIGAIQSELGDNRLNPLKTLVSLNFFTREMLFKKSRES